MQPHVLAMNSTEHTLWVSALIVGLVVILAVVALLSLLIYLVKIIDRRVVAIGGTLQAAEKNTADAALIPQVAGGVALAGEVDGLPDLLATTDSTIKEVTVGATRYAGSVAKLLG